MELQFKLAPATKANEKGIEVKNYNGKKIYIGLDVHKKGWQVSIRIDNREIENYSMDPDPDQLYRSLKRKYPGAIYYCVYEAGFSGYWIHRRLIGLGINNIITHPADIPQRGKEKARKTDRTDASKLSRELESGNLEGIYVPGEAEETIRSMNRYRKVLSRQGAKIKTQIKHFLLTKGISYPESKTGKGSWSRSRVERLMHKSSMSRGDKKIIEGKLNDLAYIARRIKEVNDELLRLIKEDEARQRHYENIRSIPGVGVVISTTLIGELGNHERFSSLDKLKSYVGLVPMTYSSGDREKVLGLSKRHNLNLRQMLIEGAWNALYRDEGMRQRYTELLKRGMKPVNAIIRIAVKLLRIIIRVWKTGEKYHKMIPVKA